MRNNKRNPVDLFFIKLIQDYFYEIAIAVLILFSIVIRIKLSTFKFGGEYISGDYNGFLSVWVNLYRENGIAGGLGQIIGDYYVPYNIILAVISVIPIFDEGIWISAVSVFGEYLGALYIFKLLKKLTGNRTRAAFCAAIMLYLPAAILDGTLWKQCDAIHLADRHEELRGFRHTGDDHHCCCAGCRDDPGLAEQRSSGSCSAALSGGVVRVDMLCISPEDA